MASSGDRVQEDTRRAALLLAALVGGLANIYLYICLILISHNSTTVQQLLIWHVGGQSIPLFGRIPWCLALQALVTAACFAWWRRFPLPSLPAARAVLAGLAFNALLIDALVLW